jgi:phosphoadenosine phosphosulfate reductase
MPTYEQYEAESIDIIKQAKAEHGAGLYTLSSFGNESAAQLSVIYDSGEDIPVLALDTGFWMPETRQHQRNLQQRFGFELRRYRPHPVVRAAIRANQTWETDLAEYNRLTKLEPLSRAIAELGITALLSGVRRHQNDHRSRLGTYAIGNDEEWRIHPLIDWPEDVVGGYFTAKDLPYHPLRAEGYGSIGDWTITRPGQGRSGRGLGGMSECGLHVPVSA